LAFRQSKIYIRLGPADHNLFSETVIGSEPPFQKSSKPVVATSETDFFRHRFLRETLRETGTDNISDSVWPSFRVLSFTRRCPLPPRHRVTAPASPGNNEGLTVEVPRAFKLPRYGVLGTRHGSTCELAQTDNGVSRRPWNWKLCIRPDKRPLRIPTECILRPKRHWASLPASGPMAFWIEGRMATMAVMAPTSLRIRRSSRCWANKRRYNGMQPSGRTTTALDQHQDNLGKRCLPAELVNGFRDAFPETRRCPRHGWYGHR
jgi:hypothetical protein